MSATPQRNGSPAAGPGCMLAKPHQPPLASLRPRFPTPALLLAGAAPPLTVRLAGVCGVLAAAEEALLSGGDQVVGVNLWGRGRGSGRAGQVWEEAGSRPRVLDMLSRGRPCPPPALTRLGVGGPPSAPPPALTLFTYCACASIHLATVPDGQPLQRGSFSRFCGGGTGIGESPKRRAAQHGRRSGQRSATGSAANAATLAQLRAHPAAAALLLTQDMMVGSSL